MSCQIEIPFNDSPADAVAKARGAVLNQNGNFDGDDYAGNFDVTVMGNRVVGNYRIEGQILFIDVTEKPFFVPCTMIESFLKNQFS